MACLAAWGSHVGQVTSHRPTSTTSRNPSVSQSLLPPPKPANYFRTPASSRLRSQIGIVVGNQPRRYVHPSPLSDPIFPDDGPSCFPCTSLPHTRRPSPVPDHHTPSRASWRFHVPRLHQIAFCRETCASNITMAVNHGASSSCCACDIFALRISSRSRWCRAPSRVVT